MMAYTIRKDGLKKDATDTFNSFWFYYFIQDRYNLAELPDIFTRLYEPNFDLLEVVRVWRANFDCLLKTAPK
jgi:hypothetical protein